MQQSRQANYATVTLQLATKALSIATDATPHRARAGERRWAMIDAFPAARIMLGLDRDGDREMIASISDELRDTLGQPTGKVTDGFGHARPSYTLLAIHLLSTAARLIDDTTAIKATRQAAESLMLRHAEPGGDDPRLAVWRRLVASQHGLTEAEELPLTSTTPAPLVPLGLNDLIDSWTYYELVGLHGLHLCSVIEQDDSLAQHVRFAAEYHLGHTQPDYTTYQPWGLAAFASDPFTAVFAEQQLHDVATHLSIEGPGSAVMPALLLADAAATMAGRLSSVWS